MSGVKIPKGEIPWVTYKNKECETVCIITSKLSRDMYYCYGINNDGQFTRLGKAKTPAEFENKFSILERMGLQPVEKPERK